MVRPITLPYLPHYTPPLCIRDSSTRPEHLVIQAVTVRPRQQQIIYLVTVITLPR